jgi:transposase InsO family protein
LEPEYFITSNGCPQECAICAVCSKKKCVIGRGIFNVLLNKLPLPEIHLSLPTNIPSENVPGGEFNNTKRYSFCGPFTKLQKRLDQGYKGVNNLDRACMQHDIAYSQNSDTKNRNAADDVLAKVATEIATDENEPEYERKQARTVAAIMATKSRFGLGLADELHKPLRRKFPRRRVQVLHKDEIWGADLVEMQDYAKENNGFRYLLTVICIFSKFAWVVPMKDKTGKSTVAAFQKIFDESGRKPKKLWVDHGKEFYNINMDAWLKQHNIERYSSSSEFKSCVIERFNRTLKTNMYKEFTRKNTFKYIDFLDELVTAYNNIKHRTVGMTPVEASKEKNKDTVLTRLRVPTSPGRQKPKFALGNKVRISKLKRPVFDRGYWPNWTEEVFEIYEVRPTNPITYRIKDLQGEIVTGSFYEQELQKTEQETFRIAKILKRRTRKGNKEILVSWSGYPEKFNSWIPAEDATVPVA